MCDLFFGFVIFILIIIWTVQYFTDREEQSKIRQAWEKGNYGEYYRLNSERKQRQKECRQAEARNAKENRWMDEILVLDAAEHGVFLPGAEQVFEDPQDNDDNNEGNYQQDLDYDEEYNQIDPDVEE